MAAQEAERINAASSLKVADYLRSAILDGHLGAGERIRQEALAAQTGASRLPVREALHTLAGEGLVLLEPNKGARVTQLDPQEFQVLYRARAAIEPIVIADSIPFLTSAQIDKADSLLTQIEKGAEAVDFLVLDREFHLLTYQECRSVHLRQIVERLWNSTQHYRRAFVTQTGESWRDDTNAEHRLLLHAISERNTTVAARIIATHIDRTRIDLDRHPEIFEPRRPPN